LRQVALRLERAGEPTYRVGALPRGELERRAEEGTLTDLPGIGKSTAGVVADALAGREPAYLSRFREPAPVGGRELRAALKGDCHTHSDWSDGGSPIREMAEAARDLGHSWIALTDHSPRLTVANGLSADRLRRQLEVVAELNAELAPFLVLTGIEVDILDDGALDQHEDLLARLDVVVASVHSKLRMPAPRMTARMVAAVSNPHVDVLGHCTGRLVTGEGRPESEFDAVEVFAACVEHDTAVEINSRPERRDPPGRLLRLAVEMGCTFTVDSDAHAPGQLDWVAFGCERAEDCGVAPDRVLNTLGAAELLAR
jgi:putative hydrolase